MDDPYISVEEPRFVSKQLQSDYYEFSDQGHFTGHRDTCVFPELVEAVIKKMGDENASPS